MSAANVAAFTDVTSVSARASSALKPTSTGTSL
jgi:hypothetical protein